MVATWQENQQRNWELMFSNFGSLCPNVTNFGSQTFGYQIWFCTRLTSHRNGRQWWANVKCACIWRQPGKNYHDYQSLKSLWTGPGRSWIAGPAGISRLGPNSEPRGNNRSFPETRERDRVPVKKIGSRDSIFGLVNSTYSFEITNHNQLVSNIKYLANFIKKYWTYFRYQKLADFLVCLPPSVRV